MANDITRIATWLQPQDILREVDVRDRPDVLEVAAAAISHASSDPTACARDFARPQEDPDGVARGRSA